MNKTAIRKFAEWAREKLIADITYKAGTLGINDSGIAEKLPQSTNDLQFFDIGTKEYVQVSGDEIKQRNALVKAIETKEKSYTTYKEAFDSIVEEVAYTWFNRLIAIRFMEVNDYLPSGLRVLSSENSLKNEPDFVTNPFETELDLTDEEEDKVIELKDNNKSDELFRMLFIKQCNKLHEILPELFENTNDYTELLLTISFTDTDGIVYKLVHDINEYDFNIEEGGGQVEIIGWLYQYYISKKHDEIVNINKGAIKKADIPAATQLFTTDWVVRYMVDNSLGRYWIERNPNSKLVDKLEFFVTPKYGKINYIDEKVSPTDLTFFDPCMGSGHILVYAFDILMEIYRECAYSDRDAAISIVENNLFGMDIDKRAYQLAYFAVMMKARSYNRRALIKQISNNLSVVEESNSIEGFVCDGLTGDDTQNKIGEYLVEAYKDAQEIGTLKTIEENDYKGFEEYLLNLENNAATIDLFSSKWLENQLPVMLQLTKQADIMSRKYAVVCTNPPYMNKLEGELKRFVTGNYKAYSGDLFSVFIYRNFDYCKEDGYSAFMTPFVWMFIKKYEELRKFIINNKSITSLVQMEYSAYEEATVPICSFVLQNSKEMHKGYYFKLSEFKGGMNIQRNKILEGIADSNCNYFFETSLHSYKLIPAMPIAYWVNDKVLSSFSEMKPLSEYAEIVSGMTTGNNDKYMRDWKEVSIERIALNKKSVDEVDLNNTYWFPYNKGGAFRRWYGNNDYVVNWSKSHEFNRAKTTMTYLYLKPCITWSDITSAIFSARACREGFFFDVKGSCAFPDELTYYPLIAFLNSKIAMMYIKILNPTITTQVGDLKRIPFNPKAYNSELVDCSKRCVQIGKEDYDSFETSWDFKKHPLTTVNTSYVGDAYISWSGICRKRFSDVKTYEYRINQFFIDMYDMGRYMDAELDDKYISIYVPNKAKDIKSLISYAVGCMFGRYSLDEEGLIYAGGEWDESKYKSFIPSSDNCILVTDEEYFEDDIVGRLEEFIKVVYGEDTLEENLQFIAGALGNKGNTSREVIRNYFLKDFIKDHIKTYQKRPIYWLFDSGKQNGFKALVYMHRWNADTIGNVRVEYLHSMQNVYGKEIERMQEIIDNSDNNKEINAANKLKEKLQKQLKETKDYDAMIAHLALSRIDIDLDDGVRVNYEKVQKSSDKKVMKVLTKI